jgi:ankyrin repeat protein
MDTADRPPITQVSEAGTASKPRRPSRLLPYLIPLLLVLVGIYFPMRKARLNESLYRAVVDGDRPLVHRILDAGADPDLRLPNLRDDAQPFNIVEWFKQLVHGRLSSRPNNQRSMLMVAASKGDGPMVEDLLAHGADHRVRLSNGSTALLLACRARKGAAAKALLDHGADLRQKDKGGLIPLVVAVREGGPDTVGTLLDHGASVGELDPDGMSVLLVAVRSRRHEVVAALLRHGADVAIFSKPVPWYPDDNVAGGQIVVFSGPGTGRGFVGRRGRPVQAALPTVPGLMYAVEHGSAEVIEAAAKTEWGMREYSTKGVWLLPNAVTSQRIDAVEALLKAGVSARNPQALCAASMSQNPRPIVDLLLRHGAAIEAPTNSGETALISACRNLKNVEFVKYLISLGANPRAKTLRGETALIEAASSPELVKLFLSLGLDAKARTVDGDSPMSSAYNPESIRLLAAAGADVNDAGTSGETPLIRAASNLDAMLELLKRGADVHIPNREGETAISRATNPKVIQALLDHGADPNEVSSSGATPLMLAVQRNDSASAAILLKHKADPNTPDRQGQTPLALALARRAQMREMVSLLEWAGAKQ